MAVQKRVNNQAIWLDKVTEVMSNFGTNRESLLPSLVYIQETLGMIPEEAANYLSEQYHVPVSEIYSVISFYSMLSTQKRGEYIIRG